MIQENLNIIITILLLNTSIIYFHKILIKKFNIYDFPDKKRKFHETKTSLFGGSIVFINIIFFTIIQLIQNHQNFFQTFYFYFFLGSLSFYLLGLVDDKKDINANIKFIIEILIVTILIIVDKNLLIEKIYFQSLDKTIYLGKYSFIFTVLSIIIFINALNMYDGINLQVGSYCIIVMSTLIYISNLDLILLILIISLITFLFLNFKSIIFLGDSGTYLLGFIISYLIIYIAKTDNYYLLSADKIFIIMLLPGLDLIRLFIIRLRNKKHPFSSDRNHAHHIIEKRLGYNKTILYLIVFSALSNLSIILFSNNLISIFFLFSIIYIISIKYYEK